MDDATEIDAQYVLPVGFGEVLERDEFGAGDGGNTTTRDDPGVGPGDVALAEVVHGLLNGLRDLVLVRNVGGDRDGVATLLLDQLQSLLRALGIDVDDTNIGAFGGEQCRPRPEPAPVIRTTLSFSFMLPPPELR